MSANAPLISTVPFFSCSSLALNARLHYTMAHHASSDLELEGLGFPLHIPLLRYKLCRASAFLLVKIDTIFRISLQPSSWNTLLYTLPLSLYSPSCPLPANCFWCFLIGGAALQTFSCPIFQQAGQPRPFPPIHFMTPTYLPIPIQIPPKSFNFLIRLHR